MPTAYGYMEFLDQQRLLTVQRPIKTQEVRTNPTHFERGRTSLTDVSPVQMKRSVVASRPYRITPSAARASPLDKFGQGGTSGGFWMFRESSRNSIQHIIQLNTSIFMQPIVCRRRSFDQRTDSGLGSSGRSDRRSVFSEVRV
jgi:hypothetical protein